MKRDPVIIIVVAMVVSIMLVFGLHMARRNSARTTPIASLQGKPAPEFTLQSLDGKTVHLSDFRGKGVLLNFWATWCQPCALEMPSLEALWRRYRDRGLIVVGVSVDRGAPKGLLEPYVRSLKLTFPILLYPDSKTSDRWRVTALPATFLVRPGGEVAGMVMGAREWNSQEMRALVERLLPHPQAHR